MFFMIYFSALSTSSALHSVLIYQKQLSVTNCKIASLRTLQLRDRTQSKSPFKQEAKIEKSTYHVLTLDIPEQSAFGPTLEIQRKKNAAVKNC